MLIHARILRRNSYSFHSVNCSKRITHASDESRGVARLRVRLALGRPYLSYPLGAVRRPGVFIPLTPHFSISHGIHVVLLPSHPCVILSRHPPPLLPLPRPQSAPFSPLTRLYNHALASPLRSRAFLGSAMFTGNLTRACLRGISSQQRFDQRAPLLDTVGSFAVRVKRKRARGAPSVSAVEK